MKLKLSEKITNILKRINNNKLSKTILDLTYQEVGDIDYNYIDISDSNALVTFTPTSKLKEINLPSVYMTSDIRNLTHSDTNDKIFEKLGYDKNEGPYWYPSPGLTKGTLLSECVSEKTGKEYALFQCMETNRKCVVNKSILREVDNSDAYFKINRNSIKIGRIATYLLNKIDFKFEPSEMEKFVNLFKSSYDFMNNKSIQFGLVNKLDISKWYHFTRYESGDGVLNNSCMNNKDGRVFQLYTKNEDKCNLVILYSDDGQLDGDKYTSSKIKGRALLWNVTTADGQERKFMDRIYTKNDSDVELFKEWAKENGWLYKGSQSMEPSETIIDGNGTLEGYMYVKLENNDFDCYPYLDTLCYMKNGELTNNPGLNHDKLFRCSEGGFTFLNDEGYYDDINNLEEHDEYDDY